MDMALWLVGPFSQAVQAMRKEDLRRRSHAAEVGHVPVQAPGRCWALKLAAWVGPE